MTKKGQKEFNSGQKKPQALINENDEKGERVQLRTVYSESLSHTGQVKNTISAQWEHNISRIGLLSDPDLKNVVDAWKNLPKAVKQGIIAMIKVCQKH